MAVYRYRALTDTGTQVSGRIEADSRDQAMNLISVKGYIPEQVQKDVGKGRQQGFFSRMADMLSPVPHKEMILYTMQLKTLLNAGVSIIRILTVLEEQTDNSKLKSATLDIQAEIRAGSTLSGAFSRHRNVFPALYCSLVRAGELSGTLPEVLDRLIYILEHEEKVRSDIKAAVRYPVIVMAFLFIAFIVLLTFVVPKFAVLFTSAGIDLPMPTRICIFLYELLNQYWQAVLTAGAAAAFILVRFIRTARGGFLMDHALLKLPFMGPLLIKTAMARFASVFSILQSSGISILDSIKLLSETLNNRAIAREFEKIEELLVEGRGISVPLAKANYFPPMVVNMVAIGEESGNLDGMLQEVAKHYDVEYEYATKLFSEALGPLLVIGLSVIVGFFAFAIFLPMWDLTKMVN